MSEADSSRKLHVCGDCFRDESIRRFVLGKAACERCDFCGRTQDGPIAAPWHSVVSLIREGLESCWTTEVEDLPFEPFDEEGNPLMSSYDTRELLEGEATIPREPSVPSPIENEAVLEELVRSIPDVWYDRVLTEEDPFGALVLQWPDFVYRVERKSRFFFFAAMNGDPESFEPAEFPTVRLLDELGALVRRTGLVKMLPLGTGLYRARQHRPGDQVATARELGPPPHSKAFSSNRMSPAGIVMFYGAFDRQTALKEAFDHRRASEEGETELTVGRFATMSDIKTIDLTEMPALPSIFDRDKRAMISGIRFLHEFVENLKRPVSRDGKEHLGYVPTQVVTEYFRHGFEDSEGDVVRGILYPGSVDNDGVCCVLFFEADQCGGEPQNPSTSQLPPQWLRIEANSVEHSKAKDLM